MKKTVWTFGLISGGIVSLLMIVATAFQDAIGFDKGEIIGYTTMVLSFLLIFFGVRSYRDNAVGGRLSFGRAFVVGSLIALISSVCYVATWEVIYFKMSPDFSAKYAAHMVEKARASGASQAAIDTKIAEMQKFQAMYSNPLMNAAITFMEPLPVGLVIALVSAGILRRKGDRDPTTGLARATD
ncbi:MAG TPA: DUF4199 domain-containing protein [Gemmatimonadaceae bacterium]|nr:DUF4199 domain-containing protein [Gemmatimonadaceae bacterium]